MRSRKTLYYFTNSYPYGLAEDWKKCELEVFVDFFDKIVVIPFWYANNENPNFFNHTKIIYHTPLFPQKNSTRLKSQALKVMFSKHLLFFLKEFFFQRVFLRFDKLIRWLSVSYQIISLIHHPLIKRILETDQGPTFYFFWGRESAEMIPLLPKNVKVVSKHYNYDLFEEDWGYLPYLSRQMKRADVIVPCSTYAKDYILKKFPFSSGKIFVDLLGTQLPKERIKSSSDQVLRLVSCSFIEPYKRVGLIVESLKHVKTKVSWTHIGDGSLREEIEGMSKQLQSINPNIIEVLFTGKIKFEMLRNYYLSREIDLFINTSLIEGIPVSVMEIMSLGVPALATNAGGMSDLISNNVNGILLEINTSVEVIAESIDSFSALSYDRKQEIKNNARQTIIDKFDAHKCASEIAKIAFG